MIETVLGKFLIGLSLTLYMFFVPVYPLIFLVGVLIGIDTISGVYVAKRIKDPVTSKKLSRFIPKVLVYTTIILLVYSLDFIILQHFMPIMLITRIITGALTVIELISLDEHLRKINKDRGFSYYFKLVKEKVISVRNDINDVIKK